MNPLDQLADISVPQAVSIWPLAWGYWVVIALVLLILSFFIHRTVVIYRHKALMRNTLRELHRVSPTDANISCKLQVMLKKVCAHYYPHHHTHVLSGQQWIEFLMQNYTGKQAERVQWAFEHICNNLYKASTPPLDTHIDSSAQTLKVRVAEWFCNNLAINKKANTSFSAQRQQKHVGNGDAYV